MTLINFNGNSLRLVSNFGWLQHEMQKSWNAILRDICLDNRQQNQHIADRPENDCPDESFEMSLALDVAKNSHKILASSLIVHPENPRKVVSFEAAMGSTYADLSNLSVIYVPLSDGGTSTGIIFWIFCFGGGRSFGQQRTVWLQLMLHDERSFNPIVGSGTFSYVCK